MYGREVVVEVGPVMLDVTDLAWPGKETPENREKRESYHAHHAYASNMPPGDGKARFSPESNEEVA